MTAEVTAYAKGGIVPPWTLAESGGAKNAMNPGILDASGRMAGRRQPKLQLGGPGRLSRRNAPGSVGEAALFSMPCADVDSLADKPTPASITRGPGLRSAAALPRGAIARAGSSRLPNPARTSLALTPGVLPLRTPYGTLPLPPLDSPSPLR